MAYDDSWLNVAGDLLPARVTRGNPEVREYLARFVEIRGEFGNAGKRDEQNGEVVRPVRDTSCREQRRLQGFFRRLMRVKTDDIAVVGTFPRHLDRGVKVPPRLFEKRSDIGTFRIRPRKASSLLALRSLLRALVCSEDVRTPSG